MISIDIFSRHTNVQQVYEKMLNITNHLRNANQNHSEISPHTLRMAIVKNPEITSTGKNAQEREHLCIVGGNVNRCSHYGK